MRPGCAGQANKGGTDGDRREYQTRLSTVHQEHRYKSNGLIRCAQCFHTTRPGDRAIAQARERARRTVQLKFSLREHSGETHACGGNDETGYLLQRSRAYPTSHVSLHVTLVRTTTCASVH